jgi:hypothetical protein
MSSSLLLNKGIHSAVVIRNAKLRMTSFSSSWDDRLDAERLRLGIVEAFKTCTGNKDRKGIHKYLTLL